MDSEQQMDPSDSEFNNDDHNDQPESSSQSDDRNAQHLPESDLPFTDPVPEMSSVETVYDFKSSPEEQVTKAALVMWKVLKSVKKEPHRSAHN